MRHNIILHRACCSVNYELAIALLTVPLKLRQCIKMNTSKAFVSIPLIRTLHVSAHAAIVRCTSSKGHCYLVVTLLYFAF
jgi:hypothetical protein